MSLYRAIVFILIVTLLVVLPAHMILLMSDNTEYRVMAYVQMSVLAALIVCLWCSRNLSLIAGVCVVGFGLIAMYINAVYLNYGNGLHMWFFPIIILLLYVGIGIWANQKVKHT